MFEQVDIPVRSDDRSVGIRLDKIVPHNFTIGVQFNHTIWVMTDSVIQSESMD